MNPNDIRGRMAALGTELDELRQLDTLTDEQDSRVDAIITEINDLGEKLTRAINVENAARSAGESAEFVRKQGESRGRVAGVQPIDGRAANPDNRTGDQPDRRSLGQRVFESDEFKALQQRQGQGVATFELESFHQERLQQRDLAHTGILPADYLEPMRIPGISRPDDPFGSLREVLNVGQTSSDSLIYFEESGFTNASAVVGEATATTGTTGLKPESAITFTQKTSDVATIAHWMPITRQMIWNAAELRTYIEGRLIDGLRLTEDEQLLTGDGTAGNMTGLLNTTDVQVLDDTGIAGSYFFDNPVADTTTDNGFFNRILRARQLIGTIGRARANFVVLNPADHEVAMTSTDAQQQYFGAGPFSAGNVATLWGLRTVINENQPAGRALVGDGRQATIWDRLQAQVQVGTINDQFVRNMLTLLAEERVGLTVFRPAAFADVTLYTP